MEHVVYMQVYLSDMRGEAEADAAWKKFFPKSAPARAILGVFRMPTNTPVEINAVAVRDLAMKKVVAGGVLAGDRLYISGTTGGGTSGDAETHVASALAEMKRTLAASGMDFANVVFMNPYLTDKMPMDVMNRVYAKHFEHGNTPARATIRVHSLPAGASVAFTGVAVRDLAKRRAVRPKNMAPSPTASPCVWAGDTYYCSAKAGFIPGPNGGIYATTVEHQVRQTMRNLLDGLEEAGLSFDNVVATNVYLDNLDEFGKMNAVYAEYFRNVKPTRTTVQPLPPTERIADGRGRYPKLEEISLVAVK
jgi:2-iminobutanoate/2-iminopropanoate deaminase